jgi:hypothetical protein
MKRALALLSLLLVCAAAASAVQNSPWINYTSAEGRYGVSLPSNPVIGTQESATADGVKFTQYKATVIDGSAVFLIGYFDHLPGTVFSLDKARDGLVAAVKGTLLSESSISIGGSPGRELKVITKGDGGTEYLLRARYYDVDQRVYVIQFITLKAEDDAVAAANATKYFDSFQILKNQ